MKKKETIENVVEFVQSGTKTKVFRQNYPVSDDLRELMVRKVFSDYMIYALDRYYHEYLPYIVEYVDDHNPREEKRYDLVQNLFWWRLLYDASGNFGSNCVEDYIAENYLYLKQKPILISWLRACEDVIPNFYYVSNKYNDRLLVVTDLLEEKTLDVIVYDPQATPPKQGEIIMGTLIPLGDGLYFPITDFYHFDYEAIETMAGCFHYHYNKHLKNSKKHEAFIEVLSIMLQIEKIISTEIQEKLPSK